MEHKHPKSEAVRKVAEVFGRAIGKSELKMEQGHVSRYDHCGTVACHGGHYLAENLDRLSEYHWDLQFCGERVLRIPDRDDGCRTSILADWSRGSTMMAKDLGFTGAYPAETLKEWASNNPAIWGNYCGLLMFSSTTAFGTEYADDIVTLSDVRDHWLKVADRLEKMENESNAE